MLPELLKKIVLFQKIIMVVHYLGQNYSHLKREAQRSGQLYTDPHFPPTNASLFLSGESDKEIVWKRPKVSL